MIDCNKLKIKNNHFERLNSVVSEIREKKANLTED